MRALVFFAVSMLAVPAASGCSGGSAAPSGSATSIEEKNISDLTPAERGRFCADNRVAFAALATGSCSLSGLDAPSLSNCQTTVTECQSSDVTAGAVCQESADAAPPDFGDCTELRVSEVETCLTAAKQYFSMLSCASFGMEPPSLPGCLETLEQRCPVLITGSGG